METNRQEMIEYFGEKGGNAILLALHKEYPYGYARILEFLQNEKRVKEYLEGNISIEEENEVMAWRSATPWLDCALTMLEGLDYASDEYPPSIKRESLDHLHHFYPPMRSILENLHIWVRSANNFLVEAFQKHLESLQAASMSMHLMPQFASSAYSYGETYQKVEFKYPIPSDGVIRNAHITLCCLIQFRYIPKTEFQKERLYGKIELSIPDISGRKENLFTTEQKQEFFVSLCVDLCCGQECLGKDLLCDAHGEFEIPPNWDAIRKALETKQLVCELKKRGKNECIS